jgi:hypothetical protein
MESSQTSSDDNKSIGFRERVVVAVIILLVVTSGFTWVVGWVVND